MQQVVQSLRTGAVRVLTVPDPLAAPGQVLIANACSVISAGTEKTTIDIGSKSLLAKARERPDLVRRALLKMREDGVLETLKAVRARMDEPLKLGYSSAGVVVACGPGVQGFRPGDRVASNGPHAGLVSVPANLCALVPEGVPLEQAAFAVLGAIALQGVRLARVGIGETIFVIGLGLIGQITVALLRSAGALVIGTDLDPGKCELALRLGARHAAPGLGAPEILGLSRGVGADAVLITASTASNQPIELAAEAVRARGRVVAVGAVGLDLPRRPFYFKEAEFVVSCSYGPGRYDPAYEEHGRDYPIGHVRWTEQRNIQAVLDLMGRGGLDLSPLVSHRFDIADADKAYTILKSGSEPYLAMVLRFPDPSTAAPTPRVRLREAAPSDRLGIACIGAGAFARAMLLPLLRREPRLAPRLLASASGLSAVASGEKHGFESVTASEDEVFSDPEVQAVFVLTRHDQHARQVARALAAGKHVFVEKPLALTLAELSQVEAALESRGATPPLLLVGFNRRFSAAARRVKEHFRDVAGPLTISIRFNAGALPPEHWTQDDEVGGGRIIGEACHAIDLASFLAGSPPCRVFAESVGGALAPAVRDDQCFLTLRHASGAVSSIAYLSGGDRAFPKERVEVMGGGRVAVIDDFRAVTLVRDGRSETLRKAQDKGHQSEIEAFASTLVGGGEAPIPWPEIRSVSLAAILAVRSLREGVPFEIDPSQALGRRD